MMPTIHSRTAALVTMLHAEFKNYHPLLSIARIAHNEKADLHLQFECHKTIAKYIEAELKSVEVKSDVREDRVVRVSLFDVEDVEVKSAPIALSNW